MATTTHQGAVSIAHPCNQCIDEHCMNTNIRNVKSDNCKIVSTCHIFAGNVVCYFYGPTAPADKASLGSIQLDTNLFVENRGYTYEEIQHSCSPNTILVKKYHERFDAFLYCLVAIKDIQEGDAVTFDYSATMSGWMGPKPCDCGSSECRSMINDFVDLNKKLQVQLLILKKLYGGSI